MVDSMKEIIPVERIENKIYLIRGQKVMLDRDLAELYGVEPKQLKRQVRRNINRFPDDFMFQLSKKEHDSLRCQVGTLKKGQHLKYLPYAFTEHGALMLSSVLRSKRAMGIGIFVVRAFVRFRQILSTHKELREKIETMERRYDQQFRVVFEAIKKMIKEPEKKGRIGFLREKN